METVKVTTKVSEDGKLTLTVPEAFKGMEVNVTLEIEKKKPDVPRDKNGWPIGFWEELYGSISDPKFERPPQCLNCRDVAQNPKL
jgi:hypothetical protein